MLSKLFSLESLMEQEQMLGDINKSDKRMSGDTTGQALEIIGKLMQLNTPYTVQLKGLFGKRALDLYLFEAIKQQVYKMNLKHFEFSKSDGLTIRYNIWY